MTNNLCSPATELSRVIYSKNLWKFKSWIRLLETSINILSIQLHTFLIHCAILQIVLQRFESSQIVKNKILKNVTFLICSVAEEIPSFASLSLRPASVHLLAAAFLFSLNLFLSAVKASTAFWGKVVFPKTVL